MKKIIPLWVVMTLFLFIANFMTMKSPAQEGLTLRPLVNIRLNKQSESAQLVPEKALVTRRLIAPTANAAQSTFISVAAALYPEFDGVPVVLDAVKFKRISFTIWTVKKDGSLERTALDDIALASFSHEAGPYNGFILTTPSRSSIIPNSPASGSFKNAIVQKVGAIYLSRMPMFFGEFPKWAVPNPDEGYQMDFQFDVDVKYSGITKNIIMSAENGLSARYIVTNNTPQIESIRPATANSPEVITTKGEDVRQFGMKWSTKIGPLSDWRFVLPPPTVNLLDGELAEWILPDMPVSPTRYYVLEWTPEPQFWVPQ